MASCSYVGSFGYICMCIINVSDWFDDACIECIKWIRSCLLSKGARISTFERVEGFCGQGMGVFSQRWRCEQISHEPSPPCLTVRAPPILMPTIYCQLACTFSTRYAHSYGARSHLLRTDVTLDSGTDPASDKSRNPLSMTHEHTPGLGWVAQCHHFQRIQFFLSGR